MRITAELYGHLDVEDVRTALERLSFLPDDQPLTEVLPLAANAEDGPHGAPVVRSLGEGKSKGPGSVDFSSEARAFFESGRQDLNLRPLGPEATNSPVQRFTAVHNQLVLAHEAASASPPVRRRLHRLPKGLLLHCC